jgi:YVTN family beta-propeller protein
MITHDKAAQLAATALDFPLDGADRKALAAHLSGCAPCRRDVAFLHQTEREIESLLVRPAPARVRSTVLAAATAPSAGQHGPLPWVTPRFGAPVGIGLAAAALLALLLATMLAGLLSGGRPPFQAVVVAPPTARTPAPTLPTVPRTTAFIAASVEVCAGARDLWASDRALWIRCPDSTLFGVNPQSLVLGSAALGVQGLVPGSSSIWVLGPHDARELDAATGRHLARLDSGAGTAGVLDGDALLVLDATTGELRRLALTTAAGAVTGTVTGSVAIPGGPVDVAMLAGSAWVAVPGTDSVVRVDDQATQVEATIGVGKGPRRLAVSAGKLWVVNDADGTVSVIDPATNTPTSIPVDPESASSVLPGIVATSDGTVWALDSHRASLVAIDAATETRIREVDVLVQSSAAAVAVIDGDLWVLDTAGWLDQVDVVPR